MCAPGCTTQTVVVAGTAGKQATRMGVFQMQPALTAGGKPVYKNSNGQFLYYWPAYVNWRIGSDVTTDVAGIRSTSSTDTLCPQDSSGWQEWDGESWVESSVAVLAGVCLRLLRRAVPRVLCPYPRQPLNATRVIPRARLATRPRARPALRGAT